jgi:hypothetical protein
MSSEGNKENQDKGASESNNPKPPNSEKTKTKEKKKKSKTKDKGACALGEPDVSQERNPQQENPSVETVHTQEITFSNKEDANSTHNERQPEAEVVYSSFTSI